MVNIIRDALVTEPVPTGIVFDFPNNKFDRKSIPSIVIISHSAFILPV